MSIIKVANVSKILDRIKKAYRLPSDAELARYLDVTTGTVATWRKRNAMKIYDILEKLSDEAKGDLNLNWLFYGEGDVFRRIPQDERYNQLSEFIVTDVYERAKEVLEIDSDQELAEQIGINHKELFKSRRENKIPQHFLDYIYKECPHQILYIMGKSDSEHLAAEPKQSYNSKTEELAVRIKKSPIRVESKVELLNTLLDIIEQEQTEDN